MLTRLRHRHSTRELPTVARFPGSGSNKDKFRSESDTSEPGPNQVPGILSGAWQQGFAAILLQAEQEPPLVPSLEQEGREQAGHRAMAAESSRRITSTVRTSTHHVIRWILHGVPAAQKTWSSRTIHFEQRMQPISCSSLSTQCRQRQARRMACTRLWVAPLFLLLCLLFRCRGMKLKGQK